jgi:hypothetical protein
MSRPAPDHALRRLVADLATLHPDDMQFVLDELGAGQRDAVEGLLRDFAGLSDKPTETPSRLAVDVWRLSPWLVERLDAAVADREMTAHARSALKACAARLYPLPDPKAELPARPGFVRRMFARRSA